jgi:hypothetical protein
VPGFIHFDNRIIHFDFCVATDACPVANAYGKQTALPDFGSG